MIDESKIDMSKTWYFGNNRSKNLKISPPRWSSPFFLTTNIEYAEEYSDYGIYKIELKSEAQSRILDFNKSSDVKKLKWPKVLIDKIREGRNDLNSIAYDMYILAYSTGDALMYIEDNAQWTQAVEYFKKKSKNIFINVDITSSVWGSEKDHQFLLQMWKDIYDAGFDGFMHVEFNSEVLAIFTFQCIDQISVKPVYQSLNEKMKSRALKKAFKAKGHAAFPKIKSDDDIVFVSDIPKDKALQLLKKACHDVSNFHPEYMEKAVKWSDDQIFGVFNKHDKRNVLAMASVSYNGDKSGAAYLHEMTGFIKGGYGKKLVMWLLQKFKKVYGQVALEGSGTEDDPYTPNEKLRDKFYATIPGLKIYRVENSIWDCPADFFYYGISDESIKEFLDKTYSSKKNTLNEDSNQFYYIDKNDEIVAKCENPIGKIGISTYDDINAAGIGNLEIFKPYRRMGHAKNVLQKLVKKLKSKYDLVYCFVDKDNYPALSLYKQLGKVSNHLNADGQYEVEFWKTAENNQSIARKNIKSMFDKVVLQYKMLFDIDLSYMKFKVDDQPVYTNGEPCYEYDPDECAGDWTSLGWIRLNPDMQSVMKRYGVSWHSAADIESFTKIIIAHELAHEIWNNIASDQFKQDIVSKANNSSFTTAYLRTVRSSKLDEETFCEYLAHLIVQQKKDMSFPEEEQKDLSRRKHIVTHRVSNDIDQFNEDDVVIAPWGITYRITSKKLIDDVNDSPYAEYLTQQQVEFLKDFDQIALLELDAVYDPPYTLDQIKQHYSDDIYRKLSKCPIHSWRANTGIELIHKEPTEEELERIWKNWQLMPQDMKDMSDQKSIELFGCTNAEHYKQLKNNDSSSIDEEEGIADNDIYLANMAKSFEDKAWFLKKMPEGIDTIVDFGGGAGDFAKFCQSKKPGLKYVIIDNNADFASKAEEQGFYVSPGLQELRQSGVVDFSKALLNMSSVIHEVYSYADPFYDDVGTFWSDVQKCNFKAIAIRDMSYDQQSMRNAPVDAILWIYENVLKSEKIKYKDKTFKEITDSFESVWGDICDIKLRKVNYKSLMHFLIKYRYQENWAREVEENYLPVSKDKLASILLSMGYKFKHKESSKLEFYGKCWKKDFKLNIPDNNSYRQQFYQWLLTLDTHIKWLLEKSNSNLNEDASKEKFYRFCYEDIGIYEATKHEIFKNYDNIDAKKRWHIIVKVSSWLPKPDLKYNNHKSWFTEKGKDMFVRDVLPLLLKYLNKDQIKIIRRSKVDNIVYSDEYQVIEK